MIITGGKTFSCPLCYIIQIGKDAKQHLQRCKGGTELGPDARSAIAAYFRHNQFVVREERLQQVDDLLTKKDSIYTRFVLLYLGGVLLKNFKPLSMVDVLKEFQVGFRVLITHDVI